MKILSVVIVIDSQLLEEMLDNGYPLTTEPNALKAMVAPPSTANRIAAMVSVRSVCAFITLLSSCTLVD